MTDKPAELPQHFDRLEIAYDVLSGANSLRAQACEVSQRLDGELLYALDRDRMFFLINMMAEKAQACAEHWIDDSESRNRVEREAA